MESAPDLREGARAPIFPSLENVIDGMVSCERDPDDCGDLEREWANAYKLCTASAMSGDPENLKHLIRFADYHTNLIETLGLTETALAKFLTTEREKLHSSHADFLEA